MQDKRIIQTGQNLIKAIDKRDQAITTTDSATLSFPTSIFGYTLLGTGIVIGLLGLGYIAKQFIESNNELNSSIPTITTITTNTITTNTINLGGFNIGSTVTETVTNITEPLINNSREVANKITEEVIDKIIKK